MFSAFAGASHQGNPRQPRSENSVSGLSQLLPAAAGAANSSIRPTHLPTKTTSIVSTRISTKLDQPPMNKPPPKKCSTGTCRKPARPGQRYCRPCHAKHQAILRKSQPKRLPDLLTQRVAEQLGTIYDLAATQGILGPGYQGKKLHRLLLRCGYHLYKGPKRFIQ